MSELIKLAERCEKADGPSFALDKAILAAFGFTWRGMNYWSDDRTMWKGRSDFTSSLDGAMSIMPAGAVWTVEDRLAWVRLLDDGDPQGVAEHQAMAATTPLALCAAILKAKAAPVSSGNREGET